jgi:class 3 adenylate cyclase/tetratricopeptide (TPR) repeat protein
MVPSPASGRAALSSNRRYLTLLFSDLSDSTRLAGAMEAEHYAALLADLRRVSEAVVPRHGGVIVRIQGDGLLAIFGHPETREDDARRAAEAALELHAQVRELRSDHWPRPDGGLSLHSGIHAGLVLLQEGDLVLGRFELLGNAANIAARLAAAAARDEILVGAQALGPLGGFFTTGPAMALALKGVDESVTAHAVLRRTQVHTSFEARAQRGQVPFVGRDEPMAQLTLRLHEARDGQTRFVALCGPAGLGKTRLANEFLHVAMADGWRVLRGYCESYLGAEPLQPVQQMLRELLAMAPAPSSEAVAAAVEAGLARWAPGLAEGSALLHHVLDAAQAPAAAVSSAEPAAPAQPVRRRRPPPVEQVVAGMRDLFAGVAAQAPLLLFIDDWQWADDATRQVLGAVRLQRDLALLVLVATRSFDRGDATLSDAEVLQLQPLADGESQAAIARLLPRSDPFVAHEIQRYAGGNPLFIEELCHSIAHEDMERSLARLRSGASSLSALVESRLARLPDVQADVVRAAAVIGNVMPVWLLEELTGCGAEHPLVQELVAQDFVYPGETAGTLRFKHGITRDVVYESVGLHLRRSLHLRIAELLRQRATQAGQEVAHEAMAYHYGAGGNTGLAARHAAAAGDRAVARSALDRAKAQYRAALTALDAQPPSRAYYDAWSAVSSKLALVCVFDASRADLVTFRRAVALAMDSGDQAAQARALYWLGYISYSLGEARAAVFHCELALAAARHVGDGPLEVQVRATLGQAHTAAGDYDRALPLLDEAIAIKRQHRSGQRPAVGLAFTLVCRAWAQGDRGDFAAALSSIAEALDMVGHLTHEIRASVQGWHSALLLWQGRWADALQAAEDSTRIAEETRSLFQFSMGRSMAAYAQWKLAPAAQPLQSLLDATSWLEPREGGLFKSFNHGWLADALVDCGRVAEAREHGAKALRRGRQHDIIGVAMALRALSRASESDGRIERAAHYLQQADRVAQRRQSAHELALNRLHEAGLCLRHGRRQRALDLLDATLPDFERMGMHWHLAQAQALLDAA